MPVLQRPTVNTHRFLKQETLPRSEGRQNNSSVNGNTLLFIVVFGVEGCGHEGPFLPSIHCMYHTEDQEKTNVRLMK